MGVVVGIPAVVLDMVQKGLIERGFHDALFPNLAYRQEATFEKWEGQVGEEVVMSRAGLLEPNTDPLTPGVDPEPKQPAFEQFKARLDRYGDAIDTHMPTSAMAAANLFQRNIQTLGLQAGQSVNRLPRNALFKAYLSGNTVTTASASNSATQISVASLNGFTDVLVLTDRALAQPVSASYPLTVRISGIGLRNVIAVSPDNPLDPFGPGTLYLSSAIGGSGVAARVAVVSSQAPKVIRAGGGDSVDALGSGDIFVLQEAINSVGYLRDNNVQPHPDGFYHCHISSLANAQVFADPAFQRLNIGLPSHSIYQEGFIGHLGGVMFIMNTESPNDINSGRKTATGTNAMYSKDIGAETVNEGGVRVGRMILTGRSAIYERGFDESAYTSEAGLNGKEGSFDVVNNGVNISTDRIRLILRAPINRMQDTVSAAWSITTSFPVPSDIGSGGPQRYKRAMVIEHSLG